MNQNEGMMDPFGNNLMNPMAIPNMMMNQMNMMNQNMINQVNNNMMMPIVNFNDNMAMDQMGNNNMMMNQDNNYMRNHYNHYLLDNNKIAIVFYRNEYIDSISKNIFTEYDDDISKIRNKLLLIYSNLKKKIYREPYSDEVILRESPKDTLEYLLKRGALEINPKIELYISPNEKGFHLGWKSINEITNILNSNKIIIKDLSISEISFSIPLRGAGDLVGLEFVNLEGGSNAKVLKFSNKAPKWRKVCEGLNLFGKCIYSKCQAFKKEVIYKVGINKKFDFNLQKKQIECPICKKNFVPKTLGFWKCEYQIKGEKLKEGDYYKVNINGKETKGDDFEYFDTDENGTTTWTELVIFACYRQKMKYKA